MDILEFDIPVVSTEPELTIDEIEQPTVATPEENGVATMLINSITDTWNKINEYNGIIATLSSINIDNAEDIISVVKDIVDDENKNVGKLVSALKTISPNTENIELGQEEAEVKLTEALSKDTLKTITDILGKELSSSEENYIYDNWRAFYNDPELFKDTAIVDLVKQGLEEFNNSESEVKTDEEDKKVEEEEEDSEDYVTLADVLSGLDEGLNMNIKSQTKHRLGSEEYDANEGRNQRIAMYRRFANLDEDFEITEDNINDYALSRTACYSNRSKDRVKSELLKKRWSDLEEDL